MGLQKINVFNEPADPDTAKTEYVFFPYHLRSLAPKLTHIYYAFWNIDKDCAVTEPDPDAAWYGVSASNPPVWIIVPNGACKGIMNDMMALKTEFPHLKMLVSLGGWTYSRYFSACSASADKRKIIYKTAAYRLNEMDPNFGKSNAIWDGLDLDWEFPESATGLYPDHADDDWDRYVDLAKDLRASAASDGRTSFVSLRFTSCVW